MLAPYAGAGGKPERTIPAFGYALRRVRVSQGRYRPAYFAGGNPLSLSPNFVRGDVARSCWSPLLSSPVPPKSRAAVYLLLSDGDPDPADLLLSPADVSPIRRPRILPSTTRHLPRPSITRLLNLPSITRLPSRCRRLPTGHRPSRRPTPPPRPSGRPAGPGSSRRELRRLRSLWLPLLAELAFEPPTGWRGRLRRQPLELGLHEQRPADVPRPRPLRDGPGSTAEFRDGCGIPGRDVDGLAGPPGGPARPHD